MNKTIKFILKNVVRLSIAPILNIIIKRDPKIFAFSVRVGKDMFLHNTKYMFLYLQNHSYIKGIWLCDDKDMLEQFNRRGIKNVFSRKSLKGFYYTLKAKYWFYDFQPTSISDFWSSNAFCCNLWHGIPLKKIEFDIKDFYYSKFNNFQKFVFNFLRVKHDLFIVNNEYEKECYKTAFLTDSKKIKILGSPRLDVLFHDIPNADIFMEKDYINIENLYKEGKKLFFYTPTFRDTGKNIAEWLSSQELHDFLKANNAVLICKLHPYDSNTLNFNLPKEFYKMDAASDIYPVLKYSDALITDYSSIYFDYLLLDKPIIYYPVDLQEYQELCRGFYGSYENLTAGVKAYNTQELLAAMQNIVNGNDEYKKERKNLRDYMFRYQDGNNCERVVKFIEDLEANK